VGAKLLRADGSIQHAGVVVGLNGFAGHPFDGCAEGINTIYGRPEWYRNYSAVTGACQLIRRSVFEQIGGFDERMALCGSDVALCLQARAQGLQVLYTPFARLRHLESASRGASRIPNDDFACSYHYYLPLLRDGDPFYNPNLSYWSARPELRQQGEEAALAFARRYLEALGLAVANDDIPDEAQHMVRGQ
jgi:O-antigen biosynthesis protein